MSSLFFSIIINHFKSFNLLMFLYLFSKIFLE